MSDQGSSHARVLAPGQSLPDIQMVTVDGRRIYPSDFKGRSNLLLILSADPADRLLEAAARRHSEVKQREAVLVAILRCSRAEALQAGDAGRWPFLVVSDPEGSVTSRLGMPPGPEASACVTDRWGEVFHVSRLSAGDEHAQLDALLSWLDFVEHQCPECFPSEWRE